MSSRTLELIDKSIIRHLRAYANPLARLALFVVYFWFGILKLIDASPANPLVADLLTKTLPFITFPTFIVALGLYEMLIGILWVVPRGERAAIALLIPHLIMIVAPLALLPSVAWSAPFIPTLEGQYIIKNVVIIALAMSIGAKLEPFKRRWWQNS